MYRAMLQWLFYQQVKDGSVQLYYCQVIHGSWLSKSVVKYIFSVTLSIVLHSPKSSHCLLLLRVFHSLTFYYSLSFSGLCQIPSWSNQALLLNTFMILKHSFQLHTRQWWQILCTSPVRVLSKIFIKKTHTFGPFCSCLVFLETIQFLTNSRTFSHGSMYFVSPHLTYPLRAPFVSVSVKVHCTSMLLHVLL